MVVVEDEVVVVELEVVVVVVVVVVEVLEEVDDEVDVVVSYPLLARFGHSCSSPIIGGYSCLWLFFGHSCSSAIFK